jgi:hypothetical protein
MGAQGARQHSPQAPSQVGYAVQIGCADPGAAVIEQTASIMIKFIKTFIVVGLVVWPPFLAVRYWGWPAFITARYWDNSTLAVVFIAVAALTMLVCGYALIAYFVSVVIWIKNKATKREKGSNPG